MYTFLSLSFDRSHVLKVMDTVEEAVHRGPVLEVQEG